MSTPAKEPERVQGRPLSIPPAEMERVEARLATLLAEGDREALLHALEELHPSDIADLVEALEEDLRVHVLSVLPADVASETLAEMEEGEERGDLLAALHPAKGAELVQELADDDAADLLGELEPEERHRIFQQLTEEDAGDIRSLLLYDEESAGGLMTTELVSVEASLTAAQALEEVRRQGREVQTFYTVFVVDRRRQLLGTVGLDVLVTADPDDKVAALVEPPIATVLPDMDQEEVSRLIGRYNLPSIAVVNESGTLLGRITFDDVLDVIEAEQTEDIFRMHGVGGDEDALRYTWFESVRARLPWLFANLVTASMASVVVYLFSSTIESVVILAAIMPIVAGLGGNAGTQALAVTVRGIALERAAGRRRGPMVGKEMAIGLANGLVLGAVGSVLSMALGGTPLLGVVVLLAMWGNLVVAGFLGSVVPTLMDRLGIDPAVSSSMFVTPFTDLCGFLFLLGLGSWLLL